MLCVCVCVLRVWSVDELICVLVMPAGNNQNNVTNTFYFLTSTSFLICIYLSTTLAQTEISQQLNLNEFTDLVQMWSWSPEDKTYLALVSLNFSSHGCPVWFLVKCLNNYQRDCREIWDWYSWSPEDDPWLMTNLDSLTFHLVPLAAFHLSCGF